ncbi:hypothetical protein FO519_003747 [Halicephalobus sp. NKZ332]|nr:hypothetical protein FO519_003747 [Halicephalobus sp. NKZ332]
MILKSIALFCLFISNFVNGDSAWRREDSGSAERWEKDENTIDCDFNKRDGFCGWRPTSIDSADLWRIGTEVVVDSVNSISKEDDSFTYVQGQYGTPSTGSLESPKIIPTRNRKEFKFSYWKAASTPILDICVKESSAYELNCLDSISGPGQQQWIRRTVSIPVMAVPYRIVFRVRNIHSAEDIIGLDDVQVVDAIPISRLSGTQGKRFPILRAGSQKTLATLESNQELTIPRNDFKNAEERLDRAPLLGGDLSSGSSGFLMPLKINRFGMSPSGSTEKPILPDTIFPNFTAPSFPSFPSLPQGMVPGIPPPEQTKTVENIEMCRAVKCSFLENTCLWRLGPSWKRSDGNIAMEIPGEDMVTSALFKSPLGSYLEFDLWMSDDSFFTVLENMDGLDVMLFTRQGMSNNGWHRFRIPLRPSFTPVQVKLKNSLPPGGFITLSNTRLVNGNGEEVSCETLDGNPLGLPSFPALFAPSPPLVTPPAALPLQEHVEFGKLNENRNAGSSAFGGNIFEGLAPIKPMKENPPRLTAFQGYNPSGTDLISKLGASPEVEQQLRQLANRFGFDTNKIPDAGTLNVIKRFFGSKLLGNLPMNYASGVQSPTPPNVQNVPEGIKPIKPVNVEDAEFERVYKEEALKRIIPAIASSQPINAELLKKFASIISPPSSNKDRDDLITRENLDFAYINALNG